MKEENKKETMCKLWDLERELGVSRATLYRWCKRGVIKSTKLPSGHIRVPYSEVELLKGNIKKE